MLKPSQKCLDAGHTLESMRSGGWLDADLVAHGWAVDEPAPVVPAPVPDAATPAPAATATRGNYAKPVDNALGVTSLEEVHRLFNEYAPIKFYPNGYSHSQQILYVAEALAKRAGVVK